jgi:hypothetical protein
MCFGFSATSCKLLSLIAKFLVEEDERFLENLKSFWRREKVELVTCQRREDMRFPIFAECMWEG